MLPHSVELPAATRTDRAQRHPIAALSGVCLLGAMVTAIGAAALAWLGQAQPLGGQWLPTVVALLLAPSALGMLARSHRDRALAKRNGS